MTSKFFGTKLILWNLHVHCQGYLVPNIFVGLVCTMTSGSGTGLARLQKQEQTNLFCTRIPQVSFYYSNYIWKVCFSEKKNGGCKSSYQYVFLQGTCYSIYFECISTAVLYRRQHGLVLSCLLFRSLRFLVSNITTFSLCLKKLLGLYFKMATCSLGVCNQLF